MLIHVDRIGPSNPILAIRIIALTSPCFEDMWLGLLIPVSLVLVTTNEFIQVGLFILVFGAETTSK